MYTINPSKPSVSIILPCYNEKENVLLLSEEIHKILCIHEWNHEIIVVDDDSPDKTYEMLKTLNRSYVFPILRQETPSLAGSLKTGIENSKGDYLVFMDSDFNHSPEYLPILLSNLQFYDCVSASRFVYGGKSYNQLRFILSWLFNLMVRVLTRHYITDTLFGYLAIHRKILFSLKFEDIFWGHGDYCIRLMYFLQLRKTKILQIPASHEPRVHGQGNSKMVRTFIRYSRETFKLGLRIKTNDV